MYFWRDVQGHEIDCVIEKSFGKTVPIEIKASKTFTPDFFKGLLDWQKISGQDDTPMYVVYGGRGSGFTQGNKHVTSWEEIALMMKAIYG